MNEEKWVNLKKKLRGKREENKLKEVINLSQFQKPMMIYETKSVKVRSHQMWMINTQPSTLWREALIGTGTSILTIIFPLVESVHHLLNLLKHGLWNLN